MKTIDEHIKKDESEIQEAKAQGNDSKLHHLEDELNSLKEYKEHHPEDKHDPNALELFCDCLLYTSPSPRDRTRSRMPSSA